MEKHYQRLPEDLSPDSGKMSTRADRKKNEKSIAKKMAQVLVRELRGEAELRQRGDSGLDVAARWEELEAAFGRLPRKPWQEQLDGAWTMLRAAWVE